MHPHPKHITIKEVQKLQEIRAGQILKLYSDSDKEREFQIISRLGEDTESASFHVFDVIKDGESGILRQVKHENAAEFIQGQREAAACLRRFYSDEKQEILKTIIPDRTFWTDREGGWYLFSSKEPKVLRFDQCLEQIRNNKALDPDQKAEKILRCIEMLIHSISLLHSANIFHQDIKPQNFGFLNTGDLCNSIAYLFDIDTLYFAADPDYPNIIRYTKGYWEGDINDIDYAETDVNAQTDIYSIGAVLWYAFHDDNLQYSGTGNPVEQLRKHSSLLRDMQCSSAADDICKIIGKTLTPRKNRYTMLEYLLNDLQNAITALQPRVVVRSDLTDHTPRLILEDSKITAERANSALRLKMQLHLFQHPLYETAAKAPVLWVIGSGKFAEAFLDIALPLTQCFCSGTPQICMLSDKINDKQWNDYLNKRTALSSFFSINGAQAKNAARAYGNISTGYIKTPIPNGLPKPSYIFLDCMDDTENIRLLSKLKKKLHFDTAETVFSTVLHGSAPERFTEWAKVIYCNARPEEKQFQAELERISRNIHWMWSSSFDSYEQTAESYLKPKNYLSSCACALSFRYKLRMLGITESDIGKAAAEYAAQYANEEKAELLEDVEHSRWVTERCCRGYTAMTAAEAAAIGRTTDETNKKAACLVDRLLRQEIGGVTLSELQKNEWAGLDESRLEDPLDKLSLQYQKLLTESGKAYIARNQSQIQEDLTQLHDHLKSNPEYAFPSQVFDGLNICILSMLNGNGMKYADSYANRYEWLNDLLKADTAGKQILDRINEHMKMIRPMFLFRDYRHIDRELTEALPFMLTYSDEKDICILLPDLDSLTPYTPEALQLLAPMMLLDPAAVRFVLYTDCSDKAEFKKIGAFIRYALLIADARRLRVKKFRITLYAKTFITPYLARKICGLNQEEIAQQDRIVLDTMCQDFTAESAAQVFLNDWESQKNSILQCPQEPLAWLPDALNLPNAFCFCTDGGTYCFHAENCPSLSFIDQRMKKSMRRLSVEDLRTFYNLRFSYQDQPDFIDCLDQIYMDYQQYPDQWALFRNAVHHESCSLSLIPDAPCTLEYQPIPAQTMPKILHFMYCLKCLHMADMKTPIPKRSHYKLTATVAENNRDKIIKLLHHICRNPDDEPEMKHEANALRVTLLSLNPHINMPETPEEKCSITNFIERQKEQGMIRSFLEESVQFCGKQEMWLLTAQNSVNILNCYYTALAQKEFSDIALTTDGLKASVGFRLLDENEIILMLERIREEMQEEISL